MSILTVEYAVICSTAVFNFCVVCNVGSLDMQFACYSNIFVVFLCTILVILFRMCRYHLCKCFAGLLSCPYTRKEAPGKFVSYIPFYICIICYDINVLLMSQYTYWKEYVVYEELIFRQL